MHHGPHVGVARQFLLGVVQTADGLPIHHEVFDGNASEGQTLLLGLRQRFAAQLLLAQPLQRRQFLLPFFVLLLAQRLQQLARAMRQCNLAAIILR